MLQNAVESTWPSLADISRGFAVVAPKKALESVSVSAYGTEHQIRVEEDDVVSIDN